MLKLLLASLVAAQIGTEPTELSTYCDEVAPELKDACETKFAVQKDKERAMKQ
jgi:hypothetical protein